MKIKITVILLLLITTSNAKQYFKEYDKFTKENLIPKPEEGIYLQVLYRTNLNLYHGADTEIGITLTKDVHDHTSDTLTLQIREYINPETSNYLQYEFVNAKKPNTQLLKSRIRTKTFKGKDVCKALIDAFYKLGEIRLNRGFLATGLGFTIGSSNTEIIIRAIHFNGLHFEIEESQGSIFSEWFYNLREELSNCTKNQKE